jgi:hypothetical protein
MSPHWSLRSGCPHLKCADDHSLHRANAVERLGEVSLSSFGTTAGSESPSAIRAGDRGVDVVEFASRRSVMSARARSTSSPIVEKQHSEPARLLFVPSGSARYGCGRACNRRESSSMRSRPQQQRGLHTGDLEFGEGRNLRRSPASGGPCGGRAAPGCFTSILVCDSFVVGMTVQFGHAYTDPRTVRSITARIKSSGGVDVSSRGVGSSITTGPALAAERRRRTGKGAG